MRRHRQASDLTKILRKIDLLIGLATNNQYNRQIRDLIQIYTEVTMKKVLTVLLAAVMVFALAACGGGGDVLRRQRKGRRPLHR